ncbi:hypothetical protein ES708_08983 [subsurface metagenome]
MEGRLDKDSVGNILCDKCGKHNKYSTFKSSKLAKNFIGAPSCHRKLIHLCYECTKLFSTMAGGDFKR